MVGGRFPSVGPLGCSDPEPEKKGDPTPEILEFDAAPEAVERGGSVTLSWKTAHATSLGLVAGDEPVDLGDAPIANGSVEVTIDETTTFTLTASAGERSDSRTITVEATAGPPPVISSFTADPTEISAGEKAVLSWQTERVVSFALEANPGGALDVSGLDAAEGRLEVEPTSSTSYRLTVTSAFGDEVHRDVTVSVRPAPMATLTATPARIEFGGASVLAWTATNATSVTISGPDGIVHEGDEPSGEVEVSPEVMTTYTLEVTGPGGAASATAEVSVAPVIESFSRTEIGTVRVGMEVELAWKARGAHSLTLSNGDGFEVAIDEDALDEGTLLAPVGASGVFVLRAVNGDEVDTAEVTVELTELPLVAAFSVAPGAVTADADHPASVQVAWDVIGADSIHLAIDPPGTDEVLGEAAGTMLVSVVETTTFRLTAVNDAGPVEREALVLVGGSPVVTSFEASPTRVGFSEAVTISWDAVNAASVRLEQDGADVGVDPAAFRGTYEAHLVADSIFQLFVENVA
ncbi:MAG TPA: hypothetical protein VGD74_07255, partial [Vulgatibacter sp.]